MTAMAAYANSQDMTDNEKKTMTISTQPYFTEKDASLNISRTVRDPMACLSVWRSGIGRKLIPNLASTVTRLDGVLCVLFIYHALEEAGKEGRKWGWVKGFRILEGILACYLAKKGRPIYGIQALSNMESFTILKDDSRTVCNGLRQYYRGTCRRAELISKNLKTLKENTKEWCDQSLPGHLLNPLIDIIDRALKRDESVNPHKDCLSVGTMRLLDRFFNDSEWKTRLEDHLIGSSIEYKEFARLCSTIHLKEASLKDSLDAILDEVSEHNDHNALIRDVVINIERCEVFICWTAGIFNWLLRNDRNRKNKAGRELDAHLSEIRSAAAEFGAIPLEYHTRRYNQLNKVAQSVFLGSDDLIDAILEYHKVVMCERGQDPMIWLEGSVLVVGELSGSMQTIDEIAQGIKEGDWLDDYYMSAAGMIYEQLHKDPAA